MAVVRAANVERETEEIARRILDQAAAGRPFREIGVVVRPESYVPVLRTTFSRFGIPARFYFDDRLDRHPVTRFLAGAIDAMLGDGTTWKRSPYCGWRRVLPLPVRWTVSISR